MPTNNLQALLAADIPDPTDFPPPQAFPGLRQLDAACRCTICGELYDAPITLACGHCFCSMCIRQHITKEAECPTCRKPTNESQFRTNIAFEEIVNAWGIARPTVLHLTKQEQARLERSKPRDVHKTPTKRAAAPISRKRRQRSDSERSSSMDIVYIAGPSSRATDASSDVLCSTPTRKPHVSKKIKRRALSDDELHEPSSDPREEELGCTQAPSNKKVDCPVCGNRVDIASINDHIDNNCLNPRSVKSPSNGERRSEVQQWSKILGGKAKGKDKDTGGGIPDDATDRLPKVTYHVLKDKAVKELLLRHKLSIAGDKTTWITRHERWVMLYNANLDKSQASRKPVSVLRLELKKWEEISKARKTVVEDTGTYQTLHKDDFARLTEQARKSRKSKVESAPPENAEGDDSDTLVVLDSEDEEILKI